MDDPDEPAAYKRIEEMLKPSSHFIAVWTMHRTYQLPIDRSKPREISFVDVTFERDVLTQLQGLDAVQTLRAMLPEDISLPSLSKPTADIVPNVTYMTIAYRPTTWANFDSLCKLQLAKLWHATIFFNSAVEGNEDMEVSGTEF